MNGWLAMSLNESIISIRVKLQNSTLKKSGLNKFAGFDYFELSDFLPRLNELMLEEKVNDLFTIENDKATLTLIKGEERQTYSIPFIVFDTPINKQGQKSMQDIQYLGALNTYYKRYLYLNAFGITDGDVIDALENNSKMTKEQKEFITKMPKSWQEGIRNTYGTMDLSYEQAKQMIDKFNKAKKEKEERWSGLDESVSNR